MHESNYWDRNDVQSPQQPFGVAQEVAKTTGHDDVLL